ncbi:MAG: bifunctional DNA primase/polymerase, partial [Chloroflexi bacterium]|nr:bifunctional DNA primase/polymerase [Chloroflexota bacterium]
MNNSIETFMAALDRGWSVIPVSRETKKPLLLAWKRYQSECAPREDVAGWRRTWPYCNVGIVTGKVSNIWVLDVDGEEGFEELARLGVAAARPGVRTGRGVHLYFEHPGFPVPNSVCKVAPHVDVRGDGGYVIGAGSVHKNGRLYDWLETPEMCPIQPACARLMTLVMEQRDAGAGTMRKVLPVLSGASVRPGSREKAYAGSALVKELAWLAEAAQGERNDRLNRAAFAIGQMVGAEWLAYEEVERKLGDCGRDLGLTAAEVRATVTSGLRAGMEHPREMPAPQEGAYSVAPCGQALRETDAGEGNEDMEKAMVDEHRFGLTDIGNAERMAARYGIDLRYSHEWGKWLVWNGSYMEPDATAAVERLAKQTVRGMYRSAADTEGDAERKAIVKHARASESNIKIRAMLDRLKAEDGIPVRVAELDAHPWLLNCLNGTVDLRTGAIYPARREDLMTRSVPVNYDPDARCPTWTAMLERLMADNSKLTDFLRRAVGYSLTGDTSERTIFILYGTGANGKSTFLETLRSVLGNYAMRTPTETLMARRDNAATNDIARLKGARFVTASESEEGKRLAESLIKDLTGGDTISARFLNKEFFEFRPEGKIWLSTNHKPVIRGTDKGIWDRIKLVPFQVLITAAQKDRDLVRKLAAEADGILAWAVRGCIEWLRDGLAAPYEVVSATEQYRGEM